MEKRLFLAIAVSLLFIMTYSSLVSRKLPKTMPQEASQSLPVSSPAVGESKTEPISSQQDLMVSDLASPEESLKIIKNEDLYLSVDPRGSGIKESRLNIYNTALPQTNIGLLAELQDVEFKPLDLTNGISMSYDDKAKGFEISKSFRFTENRYIIEMDIEFISHSSASNYVKYSLNAGTISDDILKKHSMDSRYFEISISLPSKVLRNNFLKFNPKPTEEKIQWVGIRDKYLCSIIRPLQDVENLVKSVSAKTTSYLLQIPAFELPAGKTIKHSYLIYLGPQKHEYIEKIGLNSQDIIDFGFFDSVSQILLSALNLFYKLSKNWGVAIILFSLVIFIIMSPLSIKSFSSMKKMQEIQPLVEDLKAKYKDNPQKMHKEVMEIYREKKISPFGGCLPLILQMPIFIALYQALIRFIDLKGARFLWIKDLAEPDRLFLFPKSIPVIGNEFNLLPVIMIITMLVQQKLTSGKASQDPATAQQQKMMSLFMAVFFGFIFYSMPSGLVLYWTVNSILMLLFQMRMFLSKT